MIAFDLQCENAHSFEGWFKDGKAYEDQLKKGLIECPICNSTKISKVISTFAIKKSAGVPQLNPDKNINIEEVRKKYIDFVKRNFDDVGSDFAREALKIHYGASEPRNIRGSSTKAEEKQLKEEGIEVFKIPMPEDSSSDSDA